MGCLLLLGPAHFWGHPPFWGILILGDFFIFGIVFIFWVVFIFWGCLYLYVPLHFDQPSSKPECGITQQSSNIFVNNILSKLTFKLIDLILISLVIQIHIQFNLDHRKICDTHTQMCDYRVSPQLKTHVTHPIL